MKKIIEIVQDPKQLFLTWIINNICTNSCSYCPPSVHNGKNHYYEWDRVDKFVDELFKRYQKINLAISGGEPTLCPWLSDLVKKFRNNGSRRIGITTNGARTARYYSDLCKELDYVVLSYHPSYHDDEFMDKVLACSEKTVTTVSVMMDSRYFDKSVSMFNTLVDANIANVETMRIISWFDDNNIGHEYTKEHEKIIADLKHTKLELPFMIRAKRKIANFKRKSDIGEGSKFLFEDGTFDYLSPQDIINQRLDNFQGWECDIGLESLLVKYDGFIKKANCPSSEFIGRIQELESIKWPTNSVICPQNYCHCTTDVYVSKRKL
jgi:MoaA/NifB/PqqE/SkfB family radical SAM enzyme